MIQEINRIYNLLLIGKNYEREGNISETFKNYNKALEKFRNIKDDNGISETLIILGNLKIKLTNYNEALDNLKEALEVKKKLDQKIKIAEIREKLGDIQKGKNNFIESVKNYDKALEIYYDLNEYQLYGRCINNKGLIARYFGENETAYECFKKANKIFNEINDIEASAATVNNLGLIFAENNEYDKAEKNFNKAIDTLNNLILKIKSEELRISFRESKLKPYHFFINFYIDQFTKFQNKNYLYKLLCLLEEFKSKETLNNFKNLADFNRNSPDIRKLIQIEEQKLLYMMELRSNILRQSSKSENLKNLKKQYEKAILELKSIRNNLKEKLKIKLLLPDKFDESNIKILKNLINNEKLVVWNIFSLDLDKNNNNFFYIITWNSRGIDLIKSKPFKKKKILEIITDFHNSLNNIEGSQINRYVKFNEALIKFEKLKSFLNSIFPKKLIKDLRNFDKLIIIPNDYLYQIPWEIVHEIGLKIPIIKCLSLSLLDSYEKNEIFFLKNILIVSNPNFNIHSQKLEFEKIKLQEIKYLLEDLGINLDFLSKDMAKKSLFKNKLKNNSYEIIHFSGHAKYNLFKSDPWLSVLSFHDPDGQDLMTITELSTLELKNVSIFLVDACETARGEISKIDEPISIIRALTVSGVNSIVATNWVLFEELSYDFVRNLFVYLINGYDIAKSLYKTRLDIKDLKEEYKNPFYWGNFTLFGNPFTKFEKLKY